MTFAFGTCYSLLSVRDCEASKNTFIFIPHIIKNCKTWKYFTHFLYMDYYLRERERERESFDQYMMKESKVYHILVLTMGMFK